jgi:hypothetical protein
MVTEDPSIEDRKATSEIRGSRRQRGCRPGRLDLHVSSLPRASSQRSSFPGLKCTNKGDSFCGLCPEILHETRPRGKEAMSSGGPTLAVLGLQGLFMSIVMLYIVMFCVQLRVWWITAVQPLPSR